MEKQKSCLLGANDKRETQVSELLHLFFYTFVSQLTRKYGLWNRARIESRRVSVGLKVNIILIIESLKVIQSIAYRYTKYRLVKKFMYKVMKEQISSLVAVVTDVI